MTTLNSCNTDSLVVYHPSASKPWDIYRVRHLYRRLHFGGSQLQENQALLATPSVLVDQLINDAAGYMPTPAPVWGFWRRADYTNVSQESNAQQLDWRETMINDLRNMGLRGRLTLFWHNHFVTQISSYNAPSWMYQYYNLLQVHSMGNVKDFVKAIGKTPAMLVYLSGRDNKANSPNENYARELFELFTLGQNNNYTQQDITEAARALTGYTRRNTYGGPIEFNPNHFDSGQKTIFGTTAAYDHDSLIDHLFAVRPTEISQHIVKKLYRYFVSPELPAAAIIDALASTLINAQWEMVPLLQQLFKSEHFFAEEAIGAMIKSPYDHTLTFMQETQLDHAITSHVYYWMADLGQDLFEPIDVAGWTGDQSWINPTTLTGRWKYLEFVIWASWNDDENHFGNFLRNITTETTDPSIITRDIVDRLLPKPLHNPQDYVLATTAFKGDVPQNYFDNGQWNTSWNTVNYQVVLLLHHIMRMPEFNLK